MQKAADASVVWLNSDMQIASFHYEDGYKQMNFSNQAFFMAFLQSLMECGYRFICYFNNSQCSSYVFASWRSDALGCYMQLFISGDMACSNIRFKKTKRMDLVNIYR